MRSDFGSNVYYILSSCPNYDITNFSKSDFPYHPIGANELWRVNVIKELLNVKYGCLKLDCGPNDVNDMILHLTCN